MFYYSHVVILVMKKLKNDKIKSPKELLETILKTLFFLTLTPKQIKELKMKN